MIISNSPNTSLPRQRRFESLADPVDHQPTQMIISFFKTIARRASKGLNLSPTQVIISLSTTIARRAGKSHSNTRKNPTVPQTQVIISFFGTQARRASKCLNLFATFMPGPKIARPPQGQNFDPSKGTIPLARVQ